MLTIAHPACLQLYVRIQLATALNRTCASARRARLDLRRRAGYAVLGCPVRKQMSDRANQLIADPFLIDPAGRELAIN